MFEKLYKYTLSDGDLFENVISDKNLVINHVVIESGKIFPRHKTDAEVYIIIIKGQLSLKIQDGEEKSFASGDIIYIPYDVDSTLGNKSDKITEVFVVKINPKN